MMQFNLLPHRPQQWRRERRRFYGTLLLAALPGALLSAAGVGAIGRQRQRQRARNDWLQQAQRRLDADIGRAAALQREIDALAARSREIEALLQRRKLSPRILSTLAAQIPPGAYLEKMTQRGPEITLDGRATSNGVVALLLQNLHAQTEDVASAELLETRTGTGGRGGAPQVTFSVALTLRERQ
jgi:Tfp pilus assembly protein PilN